MMYLKADLMKKAITQIQIVPVFLKYKMKTIQFVLVVNDFGIMYLKDIDLDHLIKSLEKHYDVTLDKEGKEYVKIESDWDYDKRKVHLSSMAPYLQKALRQFDNLDLVPTKLD
jgi:hypothetical protein